MSLWSNHESAYIVYVYCNALYSTPTWEPLLVDMFLQTFFKNCVRCRLSVVGCPAIECNLTLYSIFYEFKNEMKKGRPSTLVHTGLYLYKVHYLYFCSYFFLKNTCKHLLFSNVISHVAIIQNNYINWNYFLILMLLFFISLHFTLPLRIMQGGIKIRFPTPLGYIYTYVGITYTMINI